MSNKSKAARSVEPAVSDAAPAVSDAAPAVSDAAPAAPAPAVSDAAPAAPDAAPAAPDFDADAAKLLAKREGAPNGVFKYGLKRGTAAAFKVSAGYNSPRAHKGLRGAIEAAATLAGVKIEPGVTVLTQAQLVCGAHKAGLPDLGYLWGSYVHGTSTRAKGKLGPDGFIKPEMLRPV